MFPLFLFKEVHWQIFVKFPTLIVDNWLITGLSLKRFTSRYRFGCFLLNLLDIFNLSVVLVVRMFYLLNSYNNHLFQFFDNTLLKLS